MRRFIAVLLAAFAVCGTLVAGFSFAGVVGKASPRATAVTTIDVQAYEYNFTLSSSTAPAGTVVFNVKNTGKDAHDFAIAGRKTPTLDPGQSATLTIDLAAGQYNYACTIGEHASFGMQGQFTVTGAATTTTQVITTNGTTITTTATTTQTTPPPTPVQTVAVTEKEFKIILPSTSKIIYVKKKIRGKLVRVKKIIVTPKPLKAGLTKFVIRNVGKIPHNFVIQNQQSLVYAGGKSGTFTATLTPGTAKYECSITGHAALGMKGSVVVK